MLHRLEYTNLHVALVATALTLATYALFDVPVNGYMVLLAASGAFLVYHVDRSVVDSREDRANHPDRSYWYDRHPYFVLGAPVIAFLAGIWATIHLPWWMLFVALAFAFFGLSHARPVFGGKRPKSIPWLKPFLVPGVWAIGSVVLPLAVAGRLADLGWIAAAAVIYRWMLVFPNVVLADVTDRRGDMVAGVSSIATVISPGKVRVFAAGSAAAGIAGAVLAVALSGASQLLLIDAGAYALILFAALGGRGLQTLRRTIVLDLMVAWPIVTWLVWRLGLI